MGGGGSYGIHCDCERIRYGFIVVVSYLTNLFCGNSSSIVGYIRISKGNCCTRIPGGLLDPKLCINCETDGESGSGQPVIVAHTEGAVTLLLPFS